MPSEHRGPGAAPLATSRPKYAVGIGSVLLRTSRRIRQRSAIHQTLRQLCVRSRGARSGRRGGTLQGFRFTSRWLAVGCVVRAVLLLGATAMMAGWRVWGWGGSVFWLLAGFFNPPHPQPPHPPNTAAPLRAV